jgi:hypothetical protein
MDLPGSGQGKVARSCGDCDEPSGLSGTELLSSRLHLLASKRQLY